jgi:stalled ribosome alternative rescue factor ArfA
LKRIGERKEEEIAEKGKGEVRRRDEKRGKEIYGTVEIRFTISV